MKPSDRDITLMQMIARVAGHRGPFACSNGGPAESDTHWMVRCERCGGEWCFGCPTAAGPLKFWQASKCA